MVDFGTSIKLTHLHLLTKDVVNIRSVRTGKHRRKTPLKNDGIYWENHICARQSNAPSRSTRTLQLAIASTRSADINED